MSQQSFRGRAGGASWAPGDAAQPGARLAPVPGAGSARPLQPLPAAVWHQLLVGTEAFPPSLAGQEPAATPGTPGAPSPGCACYLLHCTPVQHISPFLLPQTQTAKSSAAPSLTHIPKCVLKVRLAKKSEEKITHFCQSLLENLPPGQHIFFFSKA